MDGYRLFRKGRLGCQGEESTIQSDSSGDTWSSASGQKRVNRELENPKKRADQHDQHCGGCLTEPLIRRK